MMDFFTIAVRSSKRDAVEIYPKFLIKKSDDLMIRGGDFYAIWIEDRGLWSTDEDDAVKIIDRELDRYSEENRQKYLDSGVRVKVLHMKDAETGMIDRWHKYCQKQLRDNFHMLDEKLIFSNTEISKKDYASKRLPYPLVSGEHPAWDKLLSTLYSEEEREKIEWAIGSIVSGDSKKNQKFVVLYGAAGTGKSTVLNIVQMLFDGYYSVFDAKALGSASNSFALEAFKTNPLVAIQHDGDLSRIEDNTRLNSLVSHEKMTVNEKFTKLYSTSFKSFLFMGTNKPVKITDAKSGLIRRLIDITPSGNKLTHKEYMAAMHAVQFELGAIAKHCLDVYEENPNKFDNYVPLAMLSASNDFYNYMLDSYNTFKDADGVSLKVAWDMYKAYCEDAKVGFPLSQRAFKEELRNYFKEYYDRYVNNDGNRVRSYYCGFKTDKFEIDISELPDKNSRVDTWESWIVLKEQHSLLDDLLADCPAQYATEYETPSKPWDLVTTTLKNLDTSRLHYVRGPETFVTIDFDIPDEKGNKSLARNIEAASKWPETYAEVSKSGEALHLEYIYDGDPSKLNDTFDEHIEIKLCTGKRALRRKLTLCNDIPIATISSGLPLKGEKVLVDQKQIQSEKGLRKMIKRNLCKEIVPSTKSSIDFIFNDLEKAYNSGMQYDVEDMYNAVLAFAASSTHQADYCMKLVDKMKFKSEECGEITPAVAFDMNPPERKLAFFDIEMFRPDEETNNPGLFLFCYKFAGPDKPVVKLFNPSPQELARVIDFCDLVGFNCRKYDNHMTYAKAYRNYTNEDLYFLSQRLINDEQDARFGNAYNLSFTDVYDFAATKMSLKKWEIELDIHHQELGFPWDEPLPKELWEKAGEYCANDVVATEAVFNHLSADFTARKILAKLAGGTVNDTTNRLTTKIIFGNNKNPQSEFNYRDLSELNDSDHFVEGFDSFTRFNKDGKPVFPGYSFSMKTVTDEKTGKQKVVYKSIYRGEEVGEGGEVYAEPGMYGYVATADSASHHPSTIKAEQFFGERYTQRFVDILEARIIVKHHDEEAAKTALGGVLAEFLEDGVSMDDLAYALKIAINSVYGLTAAKFDNPFKDPRNIDNFVAKRGALFMVNLRHEVENRGFKVIHIKTDSIKIPDATPEIIKFVQDYGKLYGYTFEHESTYDRICLVNDACFIAKYATEDICQNLYGYVPKDNKKHPGSWTATAEQFQVPYVFKTLFSKEDILFKDMCEVKNVSTALYLDMNENLTEGEHNYRFVGKVGLFTPMQPGCGAGELVREGVDKEGNTKYTYTDGTKGYLWMESEMVKELGLEDKIDRSYYDKQVTKAVETIVAYGDFTWFVSDEPYTLPDYYWIDKYGLKAPNYHEPILFS